ncbi:tRNA 2-thiocytidine biosynthesis protein TtcA [Paraburkholderia xenovorans LB400]|uniref:tRNA-cytidine(32) 2-sulfurtransferase n=1 Tax=Paraburkholderia xenovorans (strain LB400) TaxID=266265 RepID=TTCA_PARXL|nr:tRNA 2-thiocytidine(32) synthetase TtcA [Paraburkholderia xenovorans]Q13T64.1 RecName: Full=tRNA-cytidine(32) 2-sulfurtransferase; AltName: Full=Two-thiocytidine biosynthesis protein A; AltName: Full=tRNA 2-thiocytidine biosynthesis protein TtcA [Paraburkholderia xenovorans LB400]ABE32725.1 tRNA s(2)C-32 sulfurtransferase [Paraburkholderia xenovorans LB400]AIP32447.1 tRNA 2-thiocytidine biosynthesis protein TtcA [Paraburkholderia xenovorans LB400]
MNAPEILNGATAAAPAGTGEATPVHARARSPLTRREQKEAYENNKLFKRLARQVGEAIVDFNMIEDGDKVMVCLSGGKDSYAMLEILMRLRERAPINFDIVAVNLDQKQPGFPEHVLPEYLKQLDIPFHIENQDTYSIVKRLVPEGKTTCSLCSRLRRGILYRVAGELGATKIALGHHRDDILQTLLLNMFYGGKLKGMPPKLQSDDGKNIVIRPLAYVKETDLEKYAELREFPIIPCNLCGSQPNLKRAEMKALVRDWEKRFPGRIENMFNALANVVPSHLMDHKLFPFAGLRATGEADPQGDIAFDEEPCSTDSGNSTTLDGAKSIAIVQFDDL